TSLNLAFNQVGDVGAAALAKSPYLNNIRWLEFGTGEISENGIRLFRERFGDEVEGFEGYF
ncbi:MAG: hypothetical protein N2C14_18860, partial [Planctomycetales bacterium]